MHKPKNVALAAGIFWATSFFLLAVISMINGYGEAILDLIGSVYIGYEATMIGVIVGTIWAFVDGFVCLYIFTWLYNMISSKN